VSVVVTSALKSLDERNVVTVAKWLALAALFWLSFVVVKIILGINLLSYATRRRVGMEARERGDVVNDFGRDPIGEGKEEQVRLSFYICALY
jgi:hypothetical protein